MKTMRYRIRVITLVLVCSVLAVVLWAAKAAWFQSGERAKKQAESPAMSVSAILDPWADPTPEPAQTQSVSAPESSVPPDETSFPSSEPLFDTTGL